MTFLTTGNRHFDNLYTILMFKLFKNQYRYVKPYVFFCIFLFDGIVGYTFTFIIFSASLTRIFLVASVYLSSLYYLLQHLWPHLQLLPSRCIWNHLTKYHLYLQHFRPYLQLSFIAFCTFDNAYYLFYFHFLHHLLEFIYQRLQVLLSCCCLIHLNLVQKPL